MSIELTKAVQGIVKSMVTKSINNGYMASDDGKVIKAGGKDIYLFSPSIYGMSTTDMFIFQPFNELVTHEDNPSLVYLKRMINTELNILLATAIPAVLTASMTIKTPNKRQQAILGEDLMTVDAKAVKYVSDLLKECKPSHKTRSIVDVNLHTHHPITRDVDGAKYASLKSPLITDMGHWTTGDKLFGIKGPTKATMSVLRRVVRLLLPDDFEQGMYLVCNKFTAGARNKALHDIYSDMIEHINNVITELKIKDINVPVISEDWTNALPMVPALLQGVPRDINGTIGKARSTGAEAIAEDTPRKLLMGERAPVAPSPFMMQPNTMMGGPLGMNSMMGMQGGPLMGGTQSMGTGPLAASPAGMIPPGYVLMPANAMPGYAPQAAPTSGLGGILA